MTNNRPPPPARKRPSGAQTQANAKRRCTARKESQRSDEQHQSRGTTTANASHSAEAAAALIERLMATDVRDVDTSAALSAKLRGKALVLEDEDKAAARTPVGARDTKGKRRWLRRTASTEAAPAANQGTLAPPPARPWHARWKRASTSDEQASQLARSPASVATIPASRWAGLHVRVESHTHGAYVGLRGVVAEHTARALRLRATNLVGKTPRRSVAVPKKGAVFVVRVQSKDVTVLGDGLRANP
ncbi:hypothetical protein PPROV_000119500 [Pycnococcus provasolii]|uniref:Uncharacterized protein n=1 Tax=Pycnococcus provasolii TaxID=41880 RepID=A0A830H725_9CHLO|nr:hypothetical protein PPROV_000119500 [Pycnococcus provasolii]